MTEPHCWQLVGPDGKIAGRWTPLSLGNAKNANWDRFGGQGIVMRCDDHEAFDKAQELYAVLRSKCTHKSTSINLRGLNPLEMEVCKDCGTSIGRDEPTSVGRRGHDGSYGNEVP